MSHKFGPGQYLVIGNPENRRVALFQAALQRAGRPQAHVLSYADLLQNADRLRCWLRDWQTTSQPFEGLAIRLESPGENAEVERLLVERGLGSKGDRGCVSLEHGCIQHPGEWFRGYAGLLRGLAQAVRDFPQARFVSDPETILLAFDKPRCHEHLMAHNICVPECLTGVQCYEQLIQRMRELGWSRVFVKLAQGSSASGIVAMRLNANGPCALTSMEMIGSGSGVRFFNNLKLRTYKDSKQVAAIVNFLCASGAHIERWLPKAVLGSLNFDLRMLVIAGQPMHCVVRSSRTPITNLHLGNQRGDLAELRQRMSETAWQDVLQLASRTAATFPNAHMLGLDILLEPGFRRPTILEVNAFGDLLPGVLFGGMDSYEAQIRAL